MRASIVVAILLATVPAAAPARPAETVRLTLDEAVDRALHSGEEMELSRVLSREAAGRVREAFSAALPQVTGSLGYTRQIESLYQAAGADSTLTGVFRNSPFGAPNRWSLEVTASQRLFSGGKISAGLQAARAVRRSAEAQERETAAQVAFRVRRAYLDAALAARVVEIAEGSLHQAQGHRDQVRLAHREGDKAEYDLLRAEVDAANQEPAAVAARNDHAIALLELKRLINLPLDQPVELATPLDFEDDRVPVLLDESLAVEDRASLAAASADVQAREQLLRLERGYRWPDLMLSTTFSQQAFPGDALPRQDQFRRNWEASLKLEFPIFLGLRTEGSIQRAHAELDRARVQLRQLREADELELAQARAELERARALLAARRVTVRQADRAHAIANVRYTNGMSTQIEVSDARLQLTTAEVHEANAVRDYRVALAALEQAVGHPLRFERRPLSEITRAIDARVPAPSDGRLAGQPDRAGPGRHEAEGKP